MMPVNSPRWLLKLTGIATKSVATINAWVRRIQVRRRPHRSLEITSTIGPKTHFTAHGM